MVATLGWRSIFLINFPLCIVGVALTIRSIPGGEQGDASHHLDPFGQLLAILAVTGLTCSVIEARPLGSGHPLVLGAAVVAIAAGVAFYVVESKTSEPMLPVGLFHLPNFSAAVVFGTFLNFSFYGMIFVLSLYLQQACGYSALGTGLAYLPLMTTFIFSNVASGMVASRTGPRLPMISGAIIMLAGFGLLSRFGLATSYSAMLPAFIVIPSGMGFAIPAMTAAILSSVDRQRSGTASAVVNAARQTGGAIGVALFGALVGNTPIQVVRGLRLASLISMACIAIATIVAWRYIHGLRRQTGKDTGKTPN
jgi:DHA2 family methylenomycin A resistance protein-like MFS transporter